MLELALAILVGFIGPMTAYLAALAFCATYQPRPQPVEVRHRIVLVEGKGWRIGR